MRVNEAKDILRPVLLNGEEFGANVHYEALSCLITDSLAPQELWHHPGTDKRGHLTTECRERGCKKAD